MGQAAAAKEDFKRAAVLELTAINTQSVSRALERIQGSTRLEIEQIRQYLEVDSLAYLSLDGMLSCAKHAPGHYCTACFSGRYPMPVDQPAGKLRFEKHSSMV